jgi:4-aminobutyrate aminotransferase-like enzyme
MAKGMGNGFPIAAVCTTKEISERLSNKTYFNTYSGNPICCAAARGVLKVIKEQNLE